MSTSSNTARETVTIPVARAELVGDLIVPDSARGLVVFAHGTGHGRTSPRNQSMASALNERGLATLLFDLLTPDEMAIDEVTRHLRFDVGFLTTRLVGATDWTARKSSVAPLPLGLLGASSGAAAALVAAASRPEAVSAVVSHSGRPDLALKILHHVRAATLLIVGGEDRQAISLNERAFKRLRAPKEMVLVNSGPQLLEEPGTFAEVARIAASWFERYLDPSQSSSSGSIPGLSTTSVDRVRQQANADR